MTMKTNPSTFSSNFWCQDVGEAAEAHWWEEKRNVTEVQKPGIDMQLASFRKPTPVSTYLLKTQFPLQVIIFFARFWSIPTVTLPSRLSIASLLSCFLNRSTCKQKVGRGERNRIVVFLFSNKHKAGAVKEIVIRLCASCRAACLNCKVDSYNSKLLKGLPFVAGYGLQVLVNKTKCD